MPKIRPRPSRKTPPRRPSLRLLLWATLMLSFGVVLSYGAPWAIHESLLRGKQWLLRSGFQVQDILVEGRMRTSPHLLRTNLGIKRGDFIFQHSPHDLQKRLEHLPWIRSCLVERHLPNVFFIRLAERRPLALWQRDGKKCLIDDEGQIIPCPVSEFPEGLLTVFGPDAPQFTESLLEILEKTPALSKRVMAAVHLRSGRWDLYLEGGCCVKLPFQGADFALKRLMTFEKNGVVRIDYLEKIDLRFQDRIILTSRQIQGI